jgi:hypothetical protein
LNRFLDNSQLAALFENRDIEKLEVVEPTPATGPEYLDDPQLASHMREGTKVVHRAAETSIFTRYLPYNIIVSK